MKNENIQEKLDCLIQFQTRLVDLAEAFDDSGHTPAGDTIRSRKDKLDGWIQKLENLALDQWAETVAKASLDICKANDLLQKHIDDIGKNVQVANKVVSAVKTVDQVFAKLKEMLPSFLI